MTATEQTRDLFDRFKQAFPNSKEQFLPTLENVMRWQWSMNEAELRAQRETMPFAMKDDRSAKALAKARRVSVFDKMPIASRDKFLILASLFPGRKVYACGSRVTGEYVETDSPKNVLKMREVLLKKEVKESDYDIAMEFKEGEKVANLRKLLPAWGDLVANLPKSEPKILIPMWDFSKLPKEEHENVVNLVTLKQWGKLMDIHNKYQLSPTFFCCDEKPAQRWFTWAVEQKIIQADGSQKTDSQVVE